METGALELRQMTSPTINRYLPWVVATALFMEQLDSTIVNTAIPAMAVSLQVTPLSLKAVVSGWMADRFGTRRVFGVAVGRLAVGDYPYVSQD